jgi:hypothetical protein
MNGKPGSRPVSVPACTRAAARPREGIVVIAEGIYLGGSVMAEQITVSVDSDVANIYRPASDDERRKLDLLVNLR